MKSSQHISIVLHLGLSITAAFSYLNATGSRNPLTVASIQTISLVVIHSATIIVCIIICTFALRGKTWPITRHILKNTLLLSHRRREWIAAILSTQHILLQCRILAPEMMPIDLFIQRLQMLHDMWHEAKIQGCILENSLHDIMDDCSSLYDRSKTLSCLPNPILEQHLKDFRKTIEKRELDQALMNPRKRRVLLKLLALRIWIEAGKKRAEMHKNGTPHQNFTRAVSPFREFNPPLPFPGLHSHGQNSPVMFSPFSSNPSPTGSGVGFHFGARSRESLSPLRAELV